jgi:hypothetical protein
MPKEDIAPYQKNLAYKHAFKKLQLDLKEVMDFTPLDLDLENRRLENLFDFVYKYKRFGSQEAMEAVAGTFLFPPIFPGISPESDWYRFEQWMQQKPVRKKLSEQLPETLLLRAPESIPEQEIEAELERLENALEQAGYGVSLNDGIPARLIYAFLYEVLGESIELGRPGGGWVFDGCSGDCPGCFQRPWCDTGYSSCFPEDENAGEMHLIDDLKSYVSASPQSLEILQKDQSETDKTLEKFKARNQEGNDPNRQARLN